LLLEKSQGTALGGNGSFYVALRIRQILWTNYLSYGSGFCW